MVNNKRDQRDLGNVIDKMKKRLVGAILAVACLIGLAFSASAETGRAVRAESLAEGILEYKLAEGGHGDVQSFIDSELAASAGVSGEWYFFALAQSGEGYDLSGYGDALAEYFDENNVSSPSSKLKFALCLAACGEKYDDRVRALLDEASGSGGIMSLVYSLHLVNNGYFTDSVSADGTVDGLLSLRKSDGGWALSGGVSDVDVTAMVLQALAPHRERREDVRGAVNEALDLLSERQLAEGDLSSYGVPNPESGAQTVIALCALGIDPEEDGRFIKNGNSLFDGILKYRLADGSFCHKAGGDTNGTATIQSLSAAVAYMRFLNGAGSFYALDPHVGIAEDSSETRVGETETELSEGGEGQEKKSLSYKLYGAVLLIAAAAAAALLLVIFKKGSPKNLAVIAAALVLLLVLLFVTDIRSPEDYYSGESEKKDEAVGAVTLSVTCEAVAGRAEHIPKDGIILAPTELEIEEGDTVWTLLTDAAKLYGLRIENNGNDRFVYISGIELIYEFDFGDLSGWTYRVNGKSTSVGAGEYVLSPGDKVEWIYTVDGGR